MCAYAQTVQTMPTTGIYMYQRHDAHKIDTHASMEHTHDKNILVRDKM